MGGGWKRNGGGRRGRSVKSGDEEEGEEEEGYDYETEARSEAHPGDGSGVIEELG
jgi:hypothetical protein